MSKNTITSAIDVASSAALVIGAALWWTPAGYMVGGILGLLFSRQASRR